MSSVFTSVRPNISLYAKTKSARIRYAPHFLLNKGKKGKSEHLYSALCGIQSTLKRSGMDHTVLPAINTIPAVYLVSVYQMAPPPIEVANI